VIFLGLGGIFACGAALRGTSRVITVNLALTFLVLAAFEGYLAYEADKGDGTRLEGTITAGFSHRDDLLGYAPDAGARVTARKLYKDEVIYDVVYNIGPDGFRVAPPFRNPPQGCAVFFGDSITFGEGLADNQALPFKAGEGTGRSFKTVNLAFSGYGPHQMLALLQADRVRPAADCAITHYIYLCIPEHVERVAGRAFWDKHGPRFSRDANGAVRRDGNFDDAPAVSDRLLPRWLTDTFERIQALRMLKNVAREYAGNDMALTIDVIREAARLAREQAPGSTFHVMLWDGSSSRRIAKLEKGLQSDGISVHRVTAAIPDFELNMQKYVLSEHDAHPNALQAELLSNYVVSRILAYKKRPDDH